MHYILRYLVIVFCGECCYILRHSIHFLSVIFLWRNSVINPRIQGSARVLAKSMAARQALASGWSLVGFLGIITVNMIGVHVNMLREVHPVHSIYSIDVVYSARQH